MKKPLCAALAVILVAGCSDADVASSNLSKAADNFEVTRRRGATEARRAAADYLRGAAANLEDTA